MSSVSNIVISGLNDSTVRVANAVSNIVNASSISPLPQNADNYSGFVPQDVVTLSDAGATNNLGVTTTTTPRTPAYITAYDPNSPQANAQGLAAAPNVDVSTELVNANVAQVSYSADAAVLKIEQKNEKALLDIVT
jgi:flagellar basal-body rod protein FlgC